jgi:hypothetical protein
LCLRAPRQTLNQSDDALAKPRSGRERFAFHQRLLDGIVVGRHEVEDVHVQGGANHIFAQADMAIIAIYNRGIARPNQLPLEQSLIEEPRALFRTAWLNWIRVVQEASKAKLFTVQL